MPTKPIRPPVKATPVEKPKPVIGEIKTPVPKVGKPGEKTKENVYTETYKEKSNKYEPVPKTPKPPKPAPAEPAPKPVIGQIKLPKPSTPLPPLKGSKEPKPYTPIYKEGPRLKRRKARVGPPKPPVR